MKHSINLTQIKGVAILMIVIHHFSQRFGISATSIINLILFQGVGIFVICSTYGLTVSGMSKTISFKDYAKRRLYRLMPEYWTVLLLTYLYLAFINPIFRLYFHQPTNLDTFILHALGLHTFSNKHFYLINPSWWYIGFQLQLYVIYYGLIKIIDTSKQSQILKIFIVGLAISAIYSLCSGIDIVKNHNYLRIGNPLLWAAPFIFGVVATNNQFIIIYIPKKHFLLLH